MLPTFDWLLPLLLPAEVEVASLLDRGLRGRAKVREHWHAPVGDRRAITGTPR